MGNCSSFRKHEDSQSAGKCKQADRDMNQNAVGSETKANFSKEEIYFDSNFVMESDSEEFFSVNGDFTPSQSLTPIHQGSGIEDPSLNKSMKKQLVELFYENANGDKPSQGKLESPNLLSVHSSDTAPRRVSKRKSSRNSHCCLTN